MVQMEIRWTQAMPGDVIINGPHGGGSDPFFTIDRPEKPLTAEQAVELLKALEPAYVDAWNADAYDADEVDSILKRIA